MARPVETIEQRITRRFFTRFQSECEALANLIRGATAKERRQCASTLIIRLMFLRFVQSKGLLGGDANYLKSKFSESRARGEDLFYALELRPLFAGRPSEGNAARLPISPVLKQLFSSEEAAGQRAEKMRIPDLAFERVFDLLDRYDWRCVSSAPSNEREITPGILGRILELRTNQRQMGAYYTGDDITEYITKRTIIPFLLDSLAREPDGEGEAALRLLQSEPDRYIYPALARDLETPASGVASGPEAARSSGGPEKKVKARPPAETPRELLARRDRLAQRRAKLRRGEARTVNDAVTLNLDLCRLALDAIENCRSARSLRAIWRALEGVTILDPTCGSGAFLFAALKILEPLYIACLVKIRLFLSEAMPERPGEFSGLLEIRDRARLEAAGSPARSFILKTIISKNLFGADVMPEAVEVCRLRLFLALLASLDDDGPVVSVSDITFNIHAGDALLGDVGLKGESDGSDEAGIDRAPLDRGAGRSPFRWAAEFPEIIARGGFDVVVGNPPYLSARGLRDPYVVRNYETAGCPDVFAWVLERTCGLVRAGGRSGQIVPLSLTFSREFDPCRRLIFQSYGQSWFSSFARIPCALFNFDVRVRNTIHIGHKSETCARPLTTRLHRWRESQRPHLFESIEYSPFEASLWQWKIPKLGGVLLAECFEQCLARPRPRLKASLVRGPTPYALYFKRSAYNWLSFSRKLPPCYDRGGRPISQSKTGAVYFADASERDLAFLLLNGKLMLAYWSVVGDDFDLTRWMFADFPVELSSICGRARARLAGLADRLEAEMDRNVVFKLNANKRVGNYNLARCRAVTDLSDRVFAALLGIERAWSDIELLYSRMVLTQFDGGDACEPRELDLIETVR